MSNAENSKKAIDALGGVNAVSKATGCSYQRVKNWTVRDSGIPKSVLWDFRDFFSPVDHIIRGATK
jgi:hypothetical protein